MHGLEMRGRAAGSGAADYSLPGPLALDVAVPDEGAMHRHGAVTTTDQQKERYGVPSPQVTSDSLRDQRLTAGCSVHGWAIWA
ncbi:MAG: hypothetical protein EOP16_01590 [Pseudonocardia sp.]|nr:MAG: hypothetical protein EOP16_01590 [Pseudonocardia sp.]